MTVIDSPILIDASIKQSGAAQLYTASFSAKLYHYPFWVGRDWQNRVWYTAL